jgi:hypothetical protein
MRTRLAIPAVVFLAVSATAVAWQGGQRWSKYASEMQSPAPDPPDAGEKTEWAFARLRYRSNGGFRRGGWGTDSNTAEQHFVQGVRRLSRVHARSNEEVIDVDSDEIYDWPWLYAVEVGRWSLSDTQAKRLRTYLDRGGFLMVDDFHGEYEWENFMQSLRKVFPDRPVVDIDDKDAIFHVLYSLDKRVQVPGAQYIRSGRTYERPDGVEPHWRAIYDDRGRILVAICHNMDLGDAWEWADYPQYPEQYASLAYRIGINYLIYSTTH